MLTLTNQTASSIRPRATAKFRTSTPETSPQSPLLRSLTGHQGKTYVITGSEALSYRQATEIISDTIGKPLRFIDETPEMTQARREREGYSPVIIEGILAIGAYQRASGRTVTITSVVADLTGAEFALDHAFVFRR